MFRLGLGEVIAIVVVAFVLVRPRDLPGFFRNVGRVYHRLLEFARVAKRSMSQFADQIDSVADEHEQPEHEQSEHEV